jgi:hypothetical protein
MSGIIPSDRCDNGLFCRDTGLLRLAAELDRLTESHFAATLSFSAATEGFRAATQLMVAAAKDFRAATQAILPRL